MSDNVLEPYTFSFGDANPASIGCSSRVWVSPTSILQCKRSRCIYVCLDCWCYEASQGAFQIWKLFSNQDRQLSSSTWSGRLFFCTKIFEFATAASRASWYQLTIFESDFLQIQLQNTCWASPKPDIQQKNCADHVSSLMPNEQIFLEENLFYENRRWFIQYCTKPELLLPVLKVKSGSIPSGFSLGFS